MFLSRTNAHLALFPKVLDGGPSLLKARVRARSTTRVEYFPLSGRGRVSILTRSHCISNRRRGSCWEKKKKRKVRPKTGYYCLLSHPPPQKCSQQSQPVSFIKSRMKNHKLLYFVPEAAAKWTQIDSGEDAKW